MFAHKSVGLRLESASTRRELSNEFKFIEFRRMGDGFMTNLLFEKISNMKDMYLGLIV